MTEIAEHLKPIQSGRGFAVMPALRSPSLDDVITAYESSNARSPHVRVQIDPRDGVPICELSAENAWKLAEQLMTLVANHYQGDARPTERRAELITQVRTVEHDAQAGAVYYGVMQGDVQRTVERKAYFDLDADGNVLGIELLEEL